MGGKGLSTCYKPISQHTLERQTQRHERALSLLIATEKPDVASQTLRVSGVDRGRRALIRRAAPVTGHTDRGSDVSPASEGWVRVGGARGRDRRAPAIPQMRDSGDVIPEMRFRRVRRVRSVRDAGDVGARGVPVRVEGARGRDRRASEIPKVRDSGDVIPEMRFRRVRRVRSVRDSGDVGARGVPVRAGDGALRGGPSAHSASRSGTTRVPCQGDRHLTLAHQGGHTEWSLLTCEDVTGNVLPGGSAPGGSAPGVGLGTRSWADVPGTDGRAATAAATPGDGDSGECESGDAAPEDEVDSAGCDSGGVAPGDRDSRGCDSGGATPEDEDTGRCDSGGATPEDEDAGGCDSVGVTPENEDTGGCDSGCATPGDEEAPALSRVSPEDLSHVSPDDGTEAPARTVRSRWFALARGLGGTRAGRRRAVHIGARLARVRYLQWAFRSARSLGGWQPGRLRGAMCAAMIARHSWSPRCEGGAALASDADFEKQRLRGQEVLGWYATYVSLLRRLQSGVTPALVETFCGGGGTSEGTRRAGGTSHGVDHLWQDDYVRRFGPEAFTEGDATDWSLIKAVAAKTGALGGCASPPCQPYSTATTHTTHPALIPRVREQLIGLFDYWSIESVAGARSAMRGRVTELRGSLFGLRVARPRLFECSFELHVDQYLSVPAAALEARCCLGARRRWYRYDEFGRVRPPCCGGNIFCPLGASPWRCTSAECADAMGIDEGHMSYERLAQSVPPSYASLRFSQMCMAIAHQRYGVPVITYDELRRRPHAARRELAMWLRGAGDASPTAGLGMLRPGPEGENAVDVAGEWRDAVEGVGADVSPITGSEPGSGAVRCVGAVGAMSKGWQHALSTARAAWTVESVGYDADAEASHREFFYSHVGGYDQSWSTGYAQGAWLQPLACYAQRDTVPAGGEWSGHNTYVDVDDAAVEAAWPAIEKALADGGGTRVSMRVPAGEVRRWKRRGFSELEWEEAYRGNEAGASEAVRARPLMWSGLRRAAPPACKLVHEELRQYMDPRDRCGWKPVAAEKAAFIFSPMETDRTAWAAATGMPAPVRKMMSEGATPNLAYEMSAAEVPQYELESDEGRRECVWECDRALAVGHLEFVPDEEGHLVKGVHPWQVALKEGKARACQDYSGLLNVATRTVPFGMPTAWDVRRRMCPDTHFAKRDLRDGFWAVPISADSRNLFVLRHPSTGRLVRATSLPFGWTDSPRLFCSMTEAVAGEFRRRAADAGVDCVVHVFCDDFLLQGVSESVTQQGIELLDDVMAELGLMWAPHKERGPARVMEFLGLLLVNVPGIAAVGLTERRQIGLLERIAEWTARRGVSTTAGPVELATLLGHLVFASQVVPGGRTYMQGMLSQMSGLEVDWDSGTVRALRSAGSVWRRVQLTGSFWRDLEWWHTSLEERNCLSLATPTRASAAITGTDASDWGTGQVAFLAGGREELQLRFTAAELRRTINWRELLGIVRILELYGERLRGMLVLVEGDNTASLGAATKWASKSPGMQELIRRLFDVCERWGIVPRFCHTPGVLLHRPDQTSRGDVVEEPRARLTARDFGLLVQRFGRFTEYVGAEREHRVPGSGNRDPGNPGICGGARADGETLVWMHPTYTTVGSALRRLGERATEAGGERLRAVVVVPDEPAAAWRPLLRHFHVEGRMCAGGTQVEMNEMGRWRARPLRRSMLVLSFPRAAGAKMARVWLGGAGAARRYGAVPAASGALGARYPVRGAGGIRGGLGGHTVE